MTEQRRALLAIAIGIVTMICGGIIISNDLYSIPNWIGELACILGGVMLLRRRQ